VADRLNRRTISMTALVVMLICGLVLLALNLTPGFLHRYAAGPFYAIIFVTGIARSFLQPSRNALGAEIVPRPLYPNAVAWRSSTWQTAAVLGPALGGLLYGFASATTAYL